MKKELLLMAVFLVTAKMAFSQEDVSLSAVDSVRVATLQNIKDTGEALEFGEYSVKKGDDLQIYLPVMGGEFYYVTKKKSLINAKLISGVAGVVGTAAGAVGIAGSRNIGVIDGALKVMNKAQAVSYGADALERIDELDISKKSKKIAGKKAKVLSWELTDEGYIVLTEVNKKKYEINLQPALLTGEVQMVKE